MFSRLTKQERTWIWVLAAAGALSRLALIARTPARLATRPYIEDAFYAFSCARHLALGQGFTVDGLHPTNGVQPLICLLYAPFFLIGGDRWSGLALTFILQALIQLASTIILVALVMRLAHQNDDDDPRSALTPAIAAALIWNLSMQFFVHNTNGLETGLMALVVLAITYTLNFSLTWPRTIALGALCGLAILTRIDCAVFVAGVCIWILLQRRTLQAIVTGALAVLVSLPWFIYGLVTFGSVMPISGQSESAHALELSTIASNVWEALIATSDIVSVFFYHQRGAIPEWANAVWVVLFMAVGVYHLRMMRPRALVARNAALQPLVWFAAFVVVYYTFFFGAPHFLSRYLHPVRLLWVVLLCASVPVIVPRLQVPWGKIALLVFAVFAIAFTTERYITNFTTTDISDLYEAGVWSTKHPEDRVGMMQSGTAGFVADNVINLDGKVNAEALRARKAGADSLGHYVETRFDYLLDWPELIQPVIAAARRDGYTYLAVDSLGRVVVYRRIP